MRISRGSAVRMLALLLNAAAFLIGVYFVVRPRDRRDVLSAAGVAAAAVLSAAALTVAATGEARSLVLRLRRIALFVNAILVSIAVVIVTLEGLRDWRRLAPHAGLVVPPLVSIVALRGRATGT